MKTKAYLLAGVFLLISLFAASQAWCEKPSGATLYGIYFDRLSAELKPESKETMNDVLDLLNEKSEMNMVIEGHTDGRGLKELNDNLSRERAQAVVDWLIKRGVEPGRLKAVGLGSAKPIADNRTEKGRARNRRVVAKGFIQSKPADISSIEKKAIKRNSEKKTTLQKEPAVYVAKGEFKFDPVVDGVEVTHDFLVENRGSKTLDILKVKPG